MFLRNFAENNILPKLINEKIIMFFFINCDIVSNCPPNPSLPGLLVESFGGHTAVSLKVSTVQSWKIMELVLPNERLDRKTAS